MRHPTVISLAAASVACWLLGGALFAAPLMSRSLLVLGIGFGIAALVAAFRLRTPVEAKPYDPYDLSELRLLMSKEERDAELEEAHAQINSAMCRCCGEVYAPELAVCPKCGKSQYC
jgi:hypothetical protein